MLGVDAIFTNITVGMKFNIGVKYDALIKRGMKSTNVANTRTIVIAELASFVLSTNMDRRVPIPMKANPIKNNVINIKIGL